MNSTADRAAAPITEVDAYCAPAFDYPPLPTESRCSRFLGTKMVAWVVMLLVFGLVGWIAAVIGKAILSPAVQSQTCTQYQVEKLERDARDLARALKGEGLVSLDVPPPLGCL